MARQSMSRMLTVVLACLLVSAVAAATVWLRPVPTQAQSGNPQCLHNACTTNCLAYQYFLAGRNNYYAWYDTAYELTGCSESGWSMAAQFLLDVAAELVEAPGGVTMQCWQMILGQLSVCADQCDEHSIPDCRYAPNVRTTITNCQQGSVSAEVDNYRNANLALEYAPNAYSRQFSVYMYLQRNGGQRLLIGKQDMPSLRYPGVWINDAALAQCRAQYNDNRCDLLDPFLAPDSVDATLDWGNSGALIDLSGLTKNHQGIDSQPSDGYVSLLSDGDRFTIQQGLYSGYKYVWEHNYTQGTYRESVEPWNAYAGDVTFTLTPVMRGWATTRAKRTSVCASPQRTR